MDKGRPALPNGECPLPTPEPHMQGAVGAFRTWLFP